MKEEKERAEFAWSRQRPVGTNWCPHDLRFERKSREKCYQKHKLEIIETETKKMQDKTTMFETSLTLVCAASGVSSAVLGELRWRLGEESE